MAFERPAPDLAKLIAAWDEFERGEQLPGKVLANMKTAGLADVLAELAESGWIPAARGHELTLSMTGSQPPVQRDAVRAIPQIIPRPVGWQPGPGTQWDHPDAPVWRPTFGELLAAATTDPQEITLIPQARLSAVLVVLAERASGPEVLLTRRSLSLTNHAGEVSFPGGRVDPDESAHDAALREALEEVGLAPGVVTVHGELGHLNTFVSRSYIVPFLASIQPNIEVAPQNMEVDRVLWTPVAELIAPGVHHSERWFWPDQVPGLPEAVLHFFELDTDVVWGATARVLIDLFERAWRVAHNSASC